MQFDVGGDYGGGGGGGGGSAMTGIPQIALYFYTAQNDDELTLQEFEPLTILEGDDNNDGWVRVQNQSGAQGVVPASYVGPDDGSSA